MGHQVAVAAVEHREVVLQSLGDIVRREHRNGGDRSELQGRVRRKHIVDDRFVFMATAHGTVKKTPLSEFSRPRPSGIIAVDLDDGGDVANDGAAGYLEASRPPALRTRLSPLPTGPWTG